MSVKRYGSLSYIRSGICVLQSLLIFRQEGLVQSQNLVADVLQFRQLFDRVILGGRSLSKKISTRYFIFRSISVAVAVAGNGFSASRKNSLSRKFFHPGRYSHVKDLTHFPGVSNVAQPIAKSLFYYPVAETRLSACYSQCLLFVK
jgi:hypothetical protein